MRRLNDNNQDSPDEMTELLKAQAGDTRTTGHEVLKLKLIATEKI